ncbi:hypothetical protein H9636_16065 [Ureibacillus sp. Re31]|uniref:Uncharacterized protein n=2 Tax=Ureibacillus galli TaxID=2762222 RepID=A0ABR8XG02_9BACL|nr:hypothetical protein [Ureibacillus galli]
MKLKQLIKDLEKLKDEYNDLKLLIEDRVRDNEIDEAKEDFERLLSLRSSIIEMEESEITFLT